MSKPQTTLATAPPDLPTWLIEELRSDHAGETGAVWIYKGILAIARNPELRSFATHHLSTEERHLALIAKEIPESEQSILLPVWKLAGFLTGAIPALFGANAVYATIDAVESFVDKHYAQQIDRLKQEDRLPQLRELLEACREDEIAHRDEARQATASPGRLLKAWSWLVGFGSEAAVNLARKG